MAVSRDGKITFPHAVNASLELLEHMAANARRAWEKAPAHHKADRERVMQQARGRSSKGSGSTTKGVSHMPEYFDKAANTLTDAELTAAITDAANRGQNDQACALRREKLNRAYVVALNTRIKADQFLASTTTVSVT
jgi:hypothetical protein